MESVLISLSWAAAVQSDLVVLVVVHVFFSSPDLLHHVSSSFLAFPSRSVTPSEPVLSHTKSPLLYLELTDYYLQHP